MANSWKFMLKKNQLTCFIFDMNFHEYSMNFHKLTSVRRKNYKLNIVILLTTILTILDNYLNIVI